MDEAHEYTTHVLVEYTRTVSSFGTPEYITIRNLSLKIHLTMGRCSGHSTGFVEATEGVCKAYDPSIAGVVVFS